MIRSQVQPFERVGLQRDVSDLLTHIITLHIPDESDCTTCGWDPYTQAALDIACTTCNGAGKIVVWRKFQIRARVSWPEPGTPNFGQVLQTGPVADCTILVRSGHKTQIDRVMSKLHGYIEADGQKLRPLSIAPVKVEQQTGWEVKCEIRQEERPYSG